MKDFRWTGRRDRAAELVAADELTDEAIAAEVGIGRTALHYWRLHPDFQERVESIRAETRAALRAKGITERQNRVDALNDIYHRMRQVIDERAADPTMAGVPGGQTGLLVRTYKAIGTGPNATYQEEYQVDTPLLKEIREHLKQVAEELGQWEEKRTVAGDRNRPFVVKTITAELPPELVAAATES